jgi:putative transposase
MDEKLKFVARYLDGESISDLCREFGISRVTGHKVITRYRESGLEALTDRSRRPVRFANQLPFQVEQQIVKIKQQWPRWGAPKIRERLISHFPDIPTPATSTVHAVLDRHGLDYELAWSVSGKPFMTPRGALVAALTASIDAVTGVTAQLSTTGGTSDGRFIADICREVAELGPVNASIHKLNEHVEIAAIDPLKDIYRGALSRLLGAPAAAGTV